jgi:hypothetical protein
MMADRHSNKLDYTYGKSGGLACQSFVARGLVVARRFYFCVKGGLEAF